MNILFNYNTSQLIELHNNKLNMVRTSRTLGANVRNTRCENKRNRCELQEHNPWCGLSEPFSTPSNLKPPILLPVPPPYFILQYLHTYTSKYCNTRVSASLHTRVSEFLNTCISKFLAIEMFKYACLSEYANICKYLNTRFEIKTVCY